MDNQQREATWIMRPFSWSQLSSFEWDREEWYQSYWIGIRSKPTKELLFGSMVDKKIQADPTFIPDLVRYPLLQHKMETVYNGIPLVGLPDAFHREERRLRDYKTGKALWTQKRADETGQLTFYSMLLYLTERIRPEELSLYIDWLPTKETGDFTIQFRDEPVVPVVFETKRTMRDVLEFGNRIQKTRELMLKYAYNHDRPL